jgi:uncharacterized protein YjaZ
MSDWSITWPDSAALSPWQAIIEHEITVTRKAAARLVRLPSLEVEIKHVPPSKVIPQLGMVGHCYGPEKFTLSFAPESDNFLPALADGAVRRQVAHELHHCLRNAGPGYGLSLGEALVSEGLAGHFVHRLFGTSPEPWECALPDEVALSHWPDKGALAATDYDHAGWFFGSGRRYPLWLGYTLGYVVVGRWLNRTAVIDDRILVNVPAADVLARARSDA